MIGICTFLIAGIAQGEIITGNLKGSITLIEVYDYQCPYCRAMASIIDSLEQHNADLRLEFIPVALINQTSLLQAASAYVISRQSPAYFESFHQGMFSSRLSANAVNIWLIRHRLNTPQFKRSLHAKWVEQAIHHGLALLRAAHTHGVPLIIISSSTNAHQSIIFKGTQTLPVLQQAINRLHQSMRRATT